MPPGVVLGGTAELLTLQLQLLFLLDPARGLYLLDKGHFGLLGHGSWVRNRLLLRAK